MLNTLTAIYIALEIAPFAALFVAAPAVIYGYIKTKTVNVWRSTCFYVFTLYCFCAYFMTMLPLPVDGSALLERSWSEMIQPIPFKNFFLIQRETWLHDLAVILFNVVLTMPLGFFLRRLYGFDRRKALIAGFLASLLFELTQLSGLFFIYPRPYRVIDVDDIITNTLGSVLGWMLVPPLSRFLPQLTDSQPQYLVQGSEVSFTHRCIAAGVDLLIVLVIVLTVIASVPGFSPYLTRCGMLERFPVFFIMVVASAAAYTALFRGNTIGYRLAGLRLTTTGGKPASVRQSVMRVLLLYVGVLSIPYWILFFMSIYTEYAGIQSVIWVMCGAVLMLFAARNLLEMMFNAITHGSSMFYDRLTKTSPAYGSSRRSSVFGIRVIDMQPLTSRAVDSLSDAVGENLRAEKISRSSITKVRLMTEGVLLDWMESGLEGTHCELRLDKRFKKKALLLSVPGGNCIRKDAEDSYVTMLGGLRLSVETYYAAEKNICRIRIP